MDKKYVLQKGKNTKRYFVKMDRNRSETWSLDINDAYIFGEPVNGAYPYVSEDYVSSLTLDGEEVLLEVETKTTVQIEIKNG